MTIWTNGKKYRIKLDSGYWMKTLWEPYELRWLWLARLIVWDEKRAELKRKKKEAEAELDWTEVK